MNEYVKRVEVSKQIIIYGAGRIGMAVYSELQEYGFDNKIICFAVSNCNEDKKEINGLKVNSIFALKEYYDNTLFLIAVSEPLVPEIENTLQTLGISNYFDGRRIYIGKWKSESKDILIKKYIAMEKGDWTNSVADLAYISHVTYCVTSNAGDTMLSKCVRKYFDYPKWNIIDMGRNVTDEMIDEINNGRALIIGGGGLFLPDTNKNSISGWQWAISNEQLDRISVPIIVYAVGYNYFPGQEANEIFKNSLTRLVQKADFVGLRNRGSISEVKKIVGKEAGNKIVYQPCITTLIDKLYSVEKNDNCKIIGINMAFDREELRFRNEKKRILDEVARAIGEIQKRGYKILYIAHMDTDLRFLKYLDSHNVKYDVENLTNEFPEKIIKTYQKLQCMIGMRGHAQMIPFGMGCRIITLGTHNKMKWFLEDINAEEWYIDLNSEICYLKNKVLDKFIKINEENRNETDKKIRKAQQKLLDISRKNFKIVKKLIDE